MESLFKTWSGEECIRKIQLSANGSNRQYFRLYGQSKQCVAAYNADVRENEAFFYFAKNLRQVGVSVPEVYAVSEDRTVYLQEDLGDSTLYAYLQSKRASGVDIAEEMKERFSAVLDDLLEMQFQGRTFDFSYSYPRADFDRQSLQWDLNYFKYYFLKVFYIPFDEQLLECDFDKFIDYLLEEDCSYFLYRDFQSRNIMLTKSDQCFYIDFQGARRGAPQYDVAALLYSAKTDIPNDIREYLLDYYIERFGKRMQHSAQKFDAELFRKRFYAYAMVRIMQAMGAYGYRGVIEKKDFFIKSIPYAVANMRRLLTVFNFEEQCEELYKVCRAITEMSIFQRGDDRLTVRVFSFSYRKGYPMDKTGNGGGFVFDCRALPNPGRYEQYRELTGQDQPVIDFLEDKDEIKQFLTNVQAIVFQSIEDYMKRGFSNLMVNFGCTGGRHRSVYCANQMAKLIRNCFDCKVVLHHIEQPQLNKTEDNL